MHRLQLLTDAHDLFMTSRSYPYLFPGIFFAKMGNFFIKKTQHGNFEIEQEVTKQVYKISDFKNQQELETNTRRIIFPYRIKNGSAVPIQEEEFREIYPKCYTYLLSEKEILWARDKGKNKFEPFLSMEMISYNETKDYGKKVLTNYYIYNNYLNSENKISLSTILQSLVSPY